MARQYFRLVKAALPAFAPVQRHGNNGVVLLIVRHNAVQVFCKRTRKRFHAGILVKMNQRPQRPFVKSEAGCVIESPETGTAGGAYAELVQRVRVQKRCIADGAEIVRLKRGRGFEAIRTDRNPGPFGQRTLANAAVGGKKQRKNSVGKRVGGATQQIGGDRSRYRATREGAPPCLPDCLDER